MWTYLRFSFGAVLTSFVFNRLFGVLSPFWGPKSHSGWLLRNRFLSDWIGLLTFRGRRVLLRSLVSLRFGCCMQVRHRLGRIESWWDRNSRLFQLLIDFSLWNVLFLYSLISLLSLVELIFLSLWRCFVNDISDLRLKNLNVTKLIGNPYFLGRFHCLGSAEGNFLLNGGIRLRNWPLVRCDVYDICFYSWHS